MIKPAGVERQAGCSDLVFVSMENWDEIWRRNQLLCAGLATRFPRSRILFVGLARDVSHALRHGQLAELRQDDVRSVVGLPNITIIRPWKLAPNSLTWSRRLNELLARRQIRAVAAGLGIRDPILWLNPHSAVHMAGRMGESAVIYDITDDWTSLTQTEKQSRLIQAQDADLCRRADAVIVCSARLFNMKRSLAANLHLVPNGVDAAQYAVVLDGTGAMPEAAAGWSRPVLGYTGTLHPDRLDVPLVEALAQGLRRGSIVLIGPNHLPPRDRSRLEAVGNVVFPGPVPYHLLPQYMRAFDVCIVPHRVTPFTESLNPIKLWEYLAAGKPIVSTEVAGFRDYPQFVRLASGAGGFLRAVEAALREDVSQRQARRNEARRHSWETRLDSVQALLASAGFREAGREA